MKKTDSDFDIFSYFGLTYKQTSILLSLQRLLVINDKNNYTDNQEKQRLKSVWLDEWTENLEIDLKNNGERLITTYDALIKEVKEELKNSEMKIWYNLVILEAVTFVPYFPLGNDIKKYKSIKYNVSKQVSFLERFVKDTECSLLDIVKRYRNLYLKALKKGSGDKKIITGCIMIAGAGVVAATCGLFAGPIAVALAGSNFPTLSGAALVSASLAYLGGGAIAAGGAGMAGGVAVIVGGGAIVGGVLGGSGSLVFYGLAKNNPKFVLTEAAKLEVILREILINQQKDIRTVQEILKKYKEHISELEKELSKLKLEEKQDKEAIKNLKESIKYLKNIYKDISRFTSAYEEGIKNNNDNDDNDE